MLLHALSFLQTPVFRNWTNELLIWHALLWEPSLPIPVHVPRLSDVCFLIFLPVPGASLFDLTKKNNSLSKGFLHLGPVLKSNLLYCRGSNDRASRRLPFLYIGANAAPASRLIQHLGGW